jgi:diguanylate cyclase (GGDEF)-like protein/PAS domain S-box-containing protein
MKEIKFHHEQLFPLVLNHVHDGIIALDAELTIIYINPAAETMSVLNSQNIQGCSIHQIFSLIEPQSLSPLLPVTDAETRENRYNSVTIGTERLITFKNALLKIYHGVTLIVEGNISSFPVTVGKPPGYIMIFRDITEERRLSALIRYHAHCDLLTGFSNSEGLTLQLQEMLENLRNQDIEHTLLELEVDRFNEIIIEAGILGMEEILKQLAQILRSQIEQRDIAARLSAETFILALRDCAIRDAIRVAGRINAAVSNRVFKYREREFLLSVSIGLVTLSEEKRNVETLLRSAKIACNCAKQKEGNRIFYFA